MYIKNEAEQRWQKFTSWYFESLLKGLKVKFQAVSANFLKATLNCHTNAKCLLFSFLSWLNPFHIIKVMNFIYLILMHGFVKSQNNL